MKKVKETKETKKLNRGSKSVRALSSSELQHVAGAQDETGGKRPV